MNTPEAYALLFCAIGMAVFYFFMELSPFGARHIPSKRRAFRMPDMRFTYTHEEVYAMLDLAGETHRPRMRRYWLLDFGFIVCFWGVMIAISLTLARPATDMFWAMGIVATARALLDITENILLLAVYRAYPDPRIHLATLAGVATAFKFLCMYAWVAMLFYELATTAFPVGG